MQQHDSSWQPHNSSSDDTQSQDKSKLPSGIYFVATPIGNLQDITYRAFQTLKEFDLIAAEDTRVTAKLLSAYNIQKPMISMHDHNESDVAGKLIAKAAGGEVIAIVSDAGMPMISDPGFRLVNLARAAGVYITVLPGASSVLTALCLSGMASHEFTFLGFLPTQNKARDAKLKEYQSVKGSLILFESPRRVVDTLKDIQAAYGIRDAALVREITKWYEEVKRAPISELITQLEAQEILGECVLVISGHAGDDRWSEEQVVQGLKGLSHLPLKAAAAELSTVSGWSKNDIYTLGIALK